MKWEIGKWVWKDPYTCERTYAKEVKEKKDKNECMKEMGNDKWEMGKKDQQYPIPTYTGEHTKSTFPHDEMYFISPLR